MALAIEPSPDGIQHAAAMIRAAADARKCWACGCLRHALDAIAAPPNDSLLEAIASAREHLVPQRYECLGCDICFPAVALNDLGTAPSCPTEDVGARSGWPPLPGAYTVLRYGAPVAVCTLNDEALAEALARVRPEEVAIVGTMHTENLGIERLISNVITNPHIRFVVVCGSDSRQMIGHLPGQSLVALAQSGTDEHQRIVGAKGKRPMLRNMPLAAIEHFRNTAEVVDRIGECNLEAVLDAVRSCAARNPGPAAPFGESRVIEPLAGAVPARMISDPAGYFVIFPDRTRRLLSLEHYANSGMLTAVIEGHTAAELYMTAIDRSLVSRLDHAAYLGRELARAEHALDVGEPYVQDAAPELASGIYCNCVDECAHADPAAEHS